jgi:hypothetical protein
MEVSIITIIMHGDDIDCLTDPFGAYHLTSRKFMEFKEIILPEIWSKRFEKKIGRFDEPLILGI